MSPFSQQRGTAAHQHAAAEIAEIVAFVELVYYTMLELWRDF